LSADAVTSTSLPSMLASQDTTSTSVKDVKTILSPHDADVCRRSHPMERS
jgi:hypothetical protein